METTPAPLDSRLAYLRSRLARALSADSKTTDRLTKALAEADATCVCRERRLS